MKKIELSLKNNGPLPIRLFLEPLPEVYELSPLATLIVVTELKEEVDSCYYVEVVQATEWIIYCPGTVSTFSTSYLTQNGLKIEPIPWDLAKD